MIDPRDLYALPIAFSLTLWDALPVYMSLGVALTILTRALLPDQIFSRWWNLREIASLEGLLYLSLFQPSMVPAYVLVTVSVAVVATRGGRFEHVPATPVGAIRVRAAELIWALLIASFAAAMIKVFAPALPDAIAFQAVLALAGSLVIPATSGTSAIPAVAVSVHLGGFIPATIWLVGSAVRQIYDHRRRISDSRVSV